jgi:DTW domain-containing protein YfiP
MARQLCSSCSYPSDNCLCTDIIPVLNTTKIIVLQHPDEVDNKKNTVQLAKLACQDCDVYVGEQPEDFSELIKQLNFSATALLFPSEDALNIDQIPNQSPTIENIIILDGTWRKAKKIYHLNPWLLSIQHLCFTLAEKSQYGIRASTIEHSLSSIETIAYTLEKLDAIPANHLLSLLNAFKVQFTKRMPKHVQQRYK